MSSASSNSAFTYGPISGPSTTPFPSTDSASSIASYTSIGSFATNNNNNNNNFRMKSESSSYSYDDQSPRSQQSHANYTHHDLSSTGSLAQTQALGAFGGSNTALHYGEQGRPTFGQGHYIPQHSRHQSFTSSSASQLGLSNGPMSSSSPYSFHEMGSQYGSYSSPSGRPSGLASETSPTRSRFPSAGYTDPRQAVRPPSRPLGLGVAVPGQASDSPKVKSYGMLNEADSPRSLKRAAEHLDDPRSPSEHAAQLRRPASFPVLGATKGGAAMYGRPIPNEARTAQTLGRSRARGGQSTPGRPSLSMLPNSAASFYQLDGRRESFGSNPTMQSPVLFHGGASSSSEELHGHSAMTMPQLIRATQLTTGSSVSTGSINTDPLYSPPGASSSSSGSSNAPRAKLELHGNLNDMAIGWSHDEWRSGRRLVQFWRRQEGTTIHATFRPILPSQYVPNSIVISCIFREDKNECFVTSVDAIYLLEALVASRFTVEEKNRIRRNLEGFRPITVSKSKRECERFFKLIMSFPNPKPRNIEKDVKVFPWKVVASALCKIIGKYSASYEGIFPMMPDAMASDPSLSATPLHTPGMSGVDLSGGHYRDAGYPSSSSPSIRDARLPDSSFDYDRQTAIYGSSHPMHTYGASQGSDFARARSSGLSFTFNDLIATGGPHPGMGEFGGATSAPSGYMSSSTNSLPFPIQTNSHNSSQTYSTSAGSGGGYDNFDTGLGGAPSGSGSSSLYNQPPPHEQQPDSARTPQDHSSSGQDDMKTESQHDPSLSDSTALATVSGYYSPTSDRRT